MITIEDIREKFKELVYLTDFNIIDTVLGCVVANQMEGDPVSLYVIGPPSTAKTEILRGLQAYEKSFHLSKITPATLFSGYLNVPGKKKKGDEKDAEKSLVVKLTNEGKNVVIIKDFTTVLAMRNEDRTEIISQLREVADGYYTSVYGSGEHVRWSGKIAFIAGVTPAIDEYHSVNQVLGERFLCYRCKNESQIDIAYKVIETSVEMVRMRREIELCVKDFLDQFGNKPDFPITTPEMIHKLVHLGVFVADMRTAVIRDRNHHIVTPPMTEGAGRITRQLLYMSYGLAVVRGLIAVDDTTYSLVKKIARDTVNQWRLEIIRYIHANPMVTTKEISDHMALSEPAIREKLRDMELIDIVIGHECEHNKKRWEITTKFNNIISASEVFVYDYLW